MSQDFKLKFDEMRESDPGKSDGRSLQNETYTMPGHVRNLCFVWPDGKMKFLNYAYLVSGEYDPDLSEIKLVFTSDTVVIKGVNLEGLFGEFLGHLRKKISCSRSRYLSGLSNDELIVSEIVVQ